MGREESGRRELEGKIDGEGDRGESGRREWEGDRETGKGTFIMSEF